MKYLAADVLRTFGKQFACKAARCSFFAGLLAGLLTVTGASPIEKRAPGDGVIPILGNYPPTPIPLSTNATVTPDSAPSGITSMNVSASTNFKGKLEGNPATGVVRITNAHPAGTYTVAVKGFDGSGMSATKTFMLTVTTPVTCNPVSFGTAATFPAGSNPRVVRVGDFNGDGKQDLAVSNSPSSSITVLLGDGAGNFTATTSLSTGDTSSPTSVAVGDFNGDGKQDLAVTRISPSNLLIFLGDGTGNFSAPATFLAGSNPGSVVVGDFNGDGKQDLAVGNGNGFNVWILLGNGAGSFSGTSYFAGDSPNPVAVGDFNGDGNQDLAAASLDRVAILLGNGAGSLSAPTNFPAGGFSNSIAVGDFNGDGNQDIVATLNVSNSVSILLGNGAGGLGGFSAPNNFAAGNRPTFVAIGDFSGDGYQDLAVSSAFTANASVLPGDGAGGFHAAIGFGSGTIFHSVAVGDFNGDGRQDLAATNTGVSILLRNCTVAPVSAVSRKAHAGAGSFDINLPLPGSLGIECRTGGATNDHQLVVTYPGDVTVDGSPQAQVTAGTGTVGSGGVSTGGMVVVSGNVVTIPLTNVPNAQIINVSLNGVNGGGNLVIPMGVLGGDLNASHGVNATDISLAKPAVGQAVNATSYRTDATANGAITASDVSLVKSLSGTAIP